MAFPHAAAILLATGLAAGLTGIQAVAQDKSQDQPKEAVAAAAAQAPRLDPPAAEPDLPPPSLPSPPSAPPPAAEAAPSSSSASPSAAPPGPAAEPAPAAPAEAQAEPAAPAGPPPDLAFGAYQRGHFITAFEEASRRLKADPTDVAAMTLLGELNLEGLGIQQDPARAAEWFRLAATGGDPQAAYALAILKLDGRGTAKDPVEARKLLERAADAVPAAATSLGLMLLGDQKPESDRRAADLFRFAANALDPDALYALAVLTRQGRGVARDVAEAATWMGRAARERNVAAQVEYGIMLFNGEGVTKDEAAAAKMFLRAAERGNAVAQNRLARLYAAGRGLPKSMVDAGKWHELAKRQGLGDGWLDNALKELTPDERRRVEEAVDRHIKGG